MTPNTGNRLMFLLTSTLTVGAVLFGAAPTATASWNSVAPRSGPSSGAIAITTIVAPGTIALGSSFQDIANLRPPAGAAMPTGLVRFDVFTARDTSCGGRPVLTSTSALFPTPELAGAKPKPVRVAGAEATSGTFTLKSTGTYRVLATYSGDTRYKASVSACQDPAAKVLVTAPRTSPPVPVTAPITTLLSSNAITLGTSFQDTANLHSLARAAAPTGTVKFQVFAPGDTTCGRRPVFTSTNPVFATPVLAGAKPNPLNATATEAGSDAFTPKSPGIYRVLATYSGDTRYRSSNSVCGEPGETVTVTASSTLPPPIPRGAPNTGGGGTAAGPDAGLIRLGIGLLCAGIGAGASTLLHLPRRGRGRA